MPEDLREILQRKQVNGVRGMLCQWCTDVMRAKVEPMKTVANIIRNHFDGIVAWAQNRQTNGLFQAAERKVRRYRRFTTIRTMIFLVA